MKTLTVLLLACSFFCVLTVRIGRTQKGAKSMWPWWLWPFQPEAQDLVCPDQGWIETKPEQATPTYLIEWCFNGAGCFHARDFVHITVKSPAVYMQCRAETAAIIRSGVGMLKSLLKGKQGAVFETIIKGADKLQEMADSSSAARNGNEFCYCFAQRWTKAEAVYATVTSDAGRTATLEIPDNYFGKVDAENLASNTLVLIKGDSCTESLWKNNVCSYSYLTTNRQISWSDLADEIAWLGDRGQMPRSFSMSKGEPPLSTS